MDTLAFAITAHASLADAKHLQPFLAWCPLEVIHCTLENTTQLACLCIQQPMHDHIKPWFPWLNCPCLHETVATNTMFSSVKGIGGHTCAQVYWGFTSHFINVYGMKSESEGLITLDDFACKEGSHQLCTAIICACNNGELAGSHSCVHGSVMPSILDHTILSKTLPRCMPSDGSSKTVRLYTNKLGHGTQQHLAVCLSIPCQCP